MGFGMSRLGKLFSSRSRRLRGGYRLLFPSKGCSGCDLGKREGKEGKEGKDGRDGKDVIDGQFKGRTPIRVSCERESSLHIHKSHTFSRLNIDQKRLQRFFRHQLPFHPLRLHNHILALDVSVDVIKEGVEPNDLVETASPELFHLVGGEVGGGEGGGEGDMGGLEVV